MPNRGKIRKIPVERQLSDIKIEKSIEKVQFRQLAIQKDQEQVPAC